MENNIFPHINDDREFHLLWKGIKDGYTQLFLIAPALTNVRETWLSALKSLKDI